MKLMNQWSHRWLVLEKGRVGVGWGVGMGCTHRQQWNVWKILKARNYCLSSSTYLCGGDFVCFCGVWGPFSRDSRRSAKKWFPTLTANEQFFALPQITAKSPPNAPETQEITTTQDRWAGWTILVHFRTFWGQFKISHTFLSFIWRSVCHSLGYLWTDPLLISVVDVGMCRCKGIIFLFSHFTKGYDNINTNTNKLCKLIKRNEGHEECY